MAHYRFLRLLMIVVVASISLGCGGGKVFGSDPPSQAPDASINAFLERYIQAIKERDPETLANVHTDPVGWTDHTGTQTFTRAEIKAMFEAMYAVVTVVYDAYAKNVNATVNGDTAVVQFIGVQDVYNSVLERRTTSEVPTTWTLQKISGSWYIAKSSTGM